MATKAEQAARTQSKTSGRNKDFDASKLDVLFEADPVAINQRYGVISVQVYQYDGGNPRIGIYRVWVSGKTNKAKQIKETCPLDAAQAKALAGALVEAAEHLEGLV